MASSSCTTPIKRARLDENVKDDSVETESDSPKSSGSKESGDSVEQKLPNEISRWTKENLQGLSIMTVYEEKTTPLEVIERFPVANPEKKQTQYFLFNHINQIEKFFKEYCHFHLALDRELNSFPRTTADIFRDDTMYTSEKFLKDMDASTEMRVWFRRFQAYGVRFGEILYNMVLRRDIAMKQNHSEKTKDSLCEYDFQFLFEAFASMFGLHSNNWMEPLIQSSALQLSKVKISGKADILFCWDIANNATGSLEDLMQIVAVCKVKRHFSITEKVERRVTRGLESGVSSTSSANLPPHIPSSLLGQHGGELLLYYPQSIRKHDVIFGIIVQETKVTFTALKMTKEEYYGIVKGKHELTSPVLIVTKPYDYMKKEDREVLIRPLLELAVRQELKPL